MPRHALRFRQTEVTRMIKGAQAAGWAPGSFMVQLVDGNPTIVPIAAAPPPSEAEALERKMQTAFGE